MAPPKVIWLQWDGSGDRDEVGEPDTSEVTWAEERIFNADYRYELVLDEVPDSTDPDTDRSDEGV